METKDQPSQQQQTQENQPQENQQSQPQPQTNVSSLQQGIQGGKRRKTKRNGKRCVRKTCKRKRIGYKSKCINKKSRKSKKSYKYKRTKKSRR
jgi:hypothetical protein